MALPPGLARARAASWRERQGARGGERGSVSGPAVRPAAGGHRRPTTLHLPPRKRRGRGPHHPPRRPATPRSTGPARWGGLAAAGDPGGRAPGPPPPPGDLLHPPRASLWGPQQPSQPPHAPGSGGAPEGGRARGRPPRAVGGGSDPRPPPPPRPRRAPSARGGPGAPPPPPGAHLQSLSGQAFLSWRTYPFSLGRIIPVRRRAGRGCGRGRAGRQRDGPPRAPPPPQPPPFPPEPRDGEAGNQLVVPSAAPDRETRRVNGGGECGAPRGEGGAEGTASGVTREAFQPGDLAFPQISAPRACPSPPVFTLRKHSTRPRVLAVQEWARARVRVLRSGLPGPSGRSGQG